MRKGEGVSQDAGEALRLYLAAAQGHEEAKIRVAQGLGSTNIADDNFKKMKMV